MLQEDSNGEASFEIIDKKASELSIGESLSSVSSAYSLPSPSLVTSPGGNLLSNVHPPTSSDFTLLPTQGSSYTSLPPQNVPSTQYPSYMPPQSIPSVPTPQPSYLPPSLQQSSPAVTTPTQTTINVATPSYNLHATQQYPATQFSAAIPPSKGIPFASVSQQQPIEDVRSGGGFIGWMKEAVSSGGLLHKVAEKAKSSVDTIITTLDPQMTEYMYSGPSDVEVALVSQNEEEIHLTRAVFYTVFKKSGINEINVNLPPKEGIAIGLDQGIEYAEEKIAAALQIRRIPTIAIQEILLQHNQKFYELNAVVMRDVERNISLQTFSQFTPIPVEAFMKRAEKELPDFARYSSSIEKTLAAYIQNCKLEWRELITGVSRSDIQAMALKSIVQMYKNHLDMKQY